jgi:predicted transcriptional regulator/uncharacterized protein YlzI (FlbEa/FlbD family)
MSEKLVKGNKLWIVVLATLVITGTVIWVNYLSFVEIQGLLITQIKENQLSQTRSAADQIEAHSYQLQDEIVTLTKFPRIDKLSSARCTEEGRVHERISSKIDSLLRIDREGNVIECSSSLLSSYFGLNVKNKDYFTVPKNTNEPYIVNIIDQGSRNGIIVSAPLFETTEYTPYPNFEGEFKGVLLSIVDIGNLYNLYVQPIINTETTFFYLVDINTKTNIMKSNGVEELNEVSLDTIKLGESYLRGFGESIITTSEVIMGKNKWLLIVITPLENVGSEIKAGQLRNILSLVLIIFVVIGATLFLVSLQKSKQKVETKLKEVNVTLDKLGINIDTEQGKFSQADISLDPGKVYLIKEDEENHAHELFLSTLNHGFAGLGIVREDPRDLRKRYNLKKTSFIWLTKNKVEGIPCETDADTIFGLIEEFVDKSPKSVILIDRLDYIIAENSFDEIIKKVYSLRDKIQNKECVVALSINPDLLEEKNLKVLETETIDLFGKQLRKKVELEEIEMNILKFINDKNVINKLASYKDVTTNFNITKPTTRVKIRKLLGLGLVQVEQKGRFKSLKITSSGRKIIR